LVTSREEYIAFCKARALSILISGDAAGAVASMIGDLNNWSGGAIYDAGELSMRYAEAAFFIADSKEIREWINRFT
jgi:hypothetical protein